MVYLRKGCITCWNLSQILALKRRCGLYSRTNFLRDYFWRFFSEKVTIWSTQLVSYDNLYHSVKEFLARISNLNTHPLATDHILMQPKLSLRQWSPKHVYTSVGLQTFSKEIQRIQMRHFAVIQHIYLLFLPSIEELKEACDSMLSLKVWVFSKTTSSTP